MEKPISEPIPSDGKVKDSPSFFFTAIVGAMLLIQVLANILSTLVAPYMLGPFRVSGGFIVFPLMFVLSNVLSEVYGYHRGRLMCWYTTAGTLFASVVFLLMYLFVGAENGAALQVLAKASWHISIVSALALTLGNWVSDIIFQKMKGMHGSNQKWYGPRAMFASIIGQILDSSTFVIFALAILFKIPPSQWPLMVFSQVFLKLCVELVFLGPAYFLKKMARKADPDVFVRPTKYGLFGGGN
jgi:hypothetical protein